MEVTVITYRFWRNLSITVRMTNDREPENGPFVAFPKPRDFVGSTEEPRRCARLFALKDVSVDFVPMMQVDRGLIGRFDSGGTRLPPMQRDR